jgi:hypothetical protein
MADNLHKAALNYLSGRGVDGLTVNSRLLPCLACTSSDVPPS